MIGRLALVVLAGSLVAVVAFNATSATLQRFGHSNPPCRGLVVVEAAYDPWTGLPHGTEFTCPVSASWPTGWHLQSTPPEEVAGTRAIPMPVGFALGCLTAAGAIFLIDRRRRRPALG